jgi:2-iminobutanoate/2-iminopropanoate deaminase
MKAINPANMHPPIAPYSHAIEVPANAKRLIISGQLGIRPDGSVPRNLDAQVEQAWKNFTAILDGAGYAIGDVVRLRIYAVSADDLPAIRNIRDRVLGDHKPASTMVVVRSLASSDFLFEVEGEAVKPS